MASNQNMQEKPETTFMVKLPINLPDDLAKSIDKEITNIVFQRLAEADLLTAGPKSDTLPPGIWGYIPPRIIFK